VKAFDSDLAKRLAFINEVDKMKSVYRQTPLHDGSRKETDAEHCWHVALMAVLLADMSAEKDLDLLRVVKMLLVHDIVEIDAGDTFFYDDAHAQDKREREDRAAGRLFGMLPEAAGRELRSLWEEFEQRATPEAKFAAAMDRLQPMLSNYATGGVSWREHGVTLPTVLARTRHICEGSPALWEYAKALLFDAADRGYLPRR